MVGLGLVVPASARVMLTLLPGNSALRGEKLDHSHTARPTAWDRLSHSTQEGAEGGLVNS